MSSIYERHKRHWLVNGQTESEDFLNDAIENFNTLVDNLQTPSCHKVKYTSPLNHEGFHIISTNEIVDETISGINTVYSEDKNMELDIKDGYETNVVISDVSRNEQQSDLKLIHVKLGIDLSSGSYVMWNDEVWLISNEEHNAVMSHRTYSMIRCGTTVKVKSDKTYLYPIVIKNLAVYSDGIRNLVSMDLSSVKYSMQIPKNDITDTIKVGTRFIIDKSVFETSMIDNVSSKNIKIITVTECVENSLDDLENDIAYNKDFEVVEETPKTKISGEDEILIGDTAIYTLSDAIHWEFKVDEPLTILTNEIGQCKVKCKSDSRFIGQVIELYAYNRIGNVLDVKEIRIGGLF